MTIKPLAAPPYTMFHNLILDEIMPRLSPNAWKVLCVAIRQTWGWTDKYSPTGRKQSDVVSYSQFKRMTGIKSDHTVNRAIQECLANGCLVRQQTDTSPGYGTPIYTYRLNTDYACPSVENAVGGQVPSAKNAVSPSAKNADGITAEFADTKERKKTTNKRVVVGAKREQGERSPGEQPVHQAIPKKNNVEPATTPAVVAGSDLLSGIGFQPRAVAVDYATRHGLSIIQAWVSYVQNAHGVKDPAAFVRARLDAGDPPPDGGAHVEITSW